MEFDKILSRIGEFGPFQKRLYFIVNLATLFGCFQVFLALFVGVKPQWKCVGPDASCRPDGLICHNAIYFDSEYTSFARDWNLVCAESYKVDLAQSLMMFGLLLGAPLFGALADKYGRTAVWRVAFAGLTVNGVLTAFSWRYEVYALLRILSGIFNAGVGMSSFIISSEIIGKSQRGFWCSALQSFYALGFPCLAIFAYFLTNWRVLSLVTSSCGILLLIMGWNLPESPRWLIIQGRTDEAEKILHQAAQENGVSISEFNLKSDSTDSSKNSEKTVYGFLDLLAYPHLCMKIGIVSICFFVNNFVYYGLSLNSSALGGNRFISFAVSGLVEIPSYIACIMLINRSGRCRSLFYFMMSGSISCLVCMMFQSRETAGSDLFITIFATLGKFGISSSFAVIYVYSAELFPTVVRNLALGLIQAISRFGAIMAPMVILTGDTYKALPMFIFGVSALIAGFVGLLLPETLNKPMPDTIDEKENEKEHKS